MAQRLKQQGSEGRRDLSLTHSALTQTEYVQQIKFLYPLAFEWQYVRVPSPMDKNRCVAGREGGCGDGSPCARTPGHSQTMRTVANTSLPCRRLAPSGWSSTSS